VADESDSSNSEKQETTLVGFPQSRTHPKQSKGRVRDLGMSKMAQQYHQLQPNLKGHWCSRCKGIWYGFVGECECPQCGNRNG
jgi:hypothetical protein